MEDSAVKSYTYTVLVQRVCDGVSVCRVHETAAALSSFSIFLPDFTQNIKYEAITSNAVAQSCRMGVI